MFGDNAKRGFDPLDGYRMFPFGENYLELYFKQNDGSQMTIENLPKDLTRRLEVPLAVGGVINGKALQGALTLQWPTMKNLPADWIIKLRDNKTEKEIDLRNESFYSFDIKGTQQKARHAKSVNTTPDQPIVLFDPAITSQSKQKSASTSNVQESRFTIIITTEEIESNIPQKFQLAQNYPNPFNPSTKIEFGLPEKSRATIEIFDILGRKVAVLADQDVFSAGFHTLTWTPNNLASGVYLYRVRTDKQAITKKMTFIK